MAEYLRVPTAILTIAALLGLSTAGHAAHDIQVVWEGFVTITDASPQCAAVAGTGAGSTHVSIYRPKIQTKDTNTYLSILQLRSATTLQNTDESFYPQMEGPTTYDGQAITGRAKNVKYNGTSSLAITPFPVKANTATVTIAGTIDNYLSTKGCTITISGVYVQRND
jgi:hypothetical protein